MARRDHRGETQSFRKATGNHIRFWTARDCPSSFCLPFEPIDSCYHRPKRFCDLDRTGTVYRTIRFFRCTCCLFFCSEISLRDSDEFCKATRHIYPVSISFPHLYDYPDSHSPAFRILFGAINSTCRTSKFNPHTLTGRFLVSSD